MEYAVGEILEGGNFWDGHEGKDHNWKMIIYESFPERGEFRVHPTGSQGSGENIRYNPNDGCISPYIPEEVSNFYYKMKEIYTKGMKIPLEINIPNNNNVTTQIKNMYK
jgi:hypothetical protein